MRDVFHAAVARIGQHGQLLPGMAIESPLVGDHRDPLDMWHVAGSRRRHSLADPAKQQGVFERAGLHPLAATMRIGVGRLFQQQTIGRRGGKDASAAVFLDQEVVIVVGIESQQ